MDTRGKAEGTAEVGQPGSQQGCVSAGGDGGGGVGSPTRRVPVASQVTGRTVSPEKVTQGEGQDLIAIFKGLC